MQRIIKISALLSLFLGFTAFGSEIPEPAHARAFVLAKRVAAMENSKDLPSRAVWLGNRVVSNSRSLAFVNAKTEKNPKKRPASQKN